MTGNSPPASFPCFERHCQVVETAEEQMITVPMEAFYGLIGSLLAFVRVDEGWYVEAYPDIRIAVERGDLRSATEHYRTVGYFEGRLPFETSVNRTYYLGTYSDIREAYLAGEIPQLQQHFILHGYREGRLANDPAAQDTPHQAAK